MLLLTAGLGPVAKQKTRILTRAILLFCSVFSLIQAELRCACALSICELVRGIQGPIFGRQKEVFQRVNPAITLNLSRQYN